MSSLVDIAASNKAYEVTSAQGNNIGWERPLELRAFLEAYERAKLDKVTDKENLTVEPLPELPKKLVAEITGADLVTRLPAATQFDLNQLIDCLAALYKREGV